MSSFQDLYEHAAADRGRAMQFLAIQEIRRNAVRELDNAGVYIEPENAEEMTDEELSNRRAEAAYAYGLQSILESSKLPLEEGDEAYAAAVCDTSTKPYCIALCVQTKMEELHAAGAERNSKSGHPVYYVIAANPDSAETVDPLRKALEVLGVAYPAWKIRLSERDPEEQVRSVMAENLRKIIERVQKDNNQEASNELAAALMSTALVFPAQRPENDTKPADGEVHLQFAKARAKDNKSYFLAFSDREHLMQWRKMGFVELDFKDYAELILRSGDQGMIIDPYVGIGACLTREMLQALQSQFTFMNGIMNAAAEMAGEMEDEAPFQVPESKGYQQQKPSVNEWWKKDKE